MSTDASQTRRYSGAQLAALTSVPRATIGFLTNIGALEPGVQRAAGRGTGHVYDDGNLAAVLAYESLRRAASASRAMRQLMKLLQSARGVDLLRQLLENKSTAAPTFAVVHETTRLRLLAASELVEFFETSQGDHAMAHVVHLPSLAETVHLIGTEAELRRLAAPGASGRVPTVRRASRTSRARRPRASEKDGERK